MSFRVGLVCARFTLFDPQMPADFPTRMRQVAEGYRQFLQQRFDVVYPGLIETPGDADQVRGALADERLDLLVVAPTMAVPPGLVLPAISAVEAPVLLWNALTRSDLGSGLTQVQANGHTTTVGCLMIGNALQRVARRSAVVTTIADDETSFHTLERTARAMAAAGSLNGRNILRLGAPIDGYADIESSDVELQRLGLREHTVSRAELVAALADESFGERDVRLVAALNRLVEQRSAICGTVNCHSDMFRWNPDVGIVACLGVARLTEHGRPFSCTGDQPTAIALYLIRCVSGAALYCEAYTPEPSTGQLLLVAGGEADPGWCAEGEQVRIVPNLHYPGLHGAGASLDFPLRLGPATLVSLSPMADSWVLVWATGEVVESRFSCLRGPNGMFRFDRGDVIDATTRWIQSGATHHNALGLGRLDVEMPAIADALGIRSVRV